MDLKEDAKSRKSQAIAIREHFKIVSASIGIADPIVCKIGVIDDNMCKVCRLLWHHEDNIRIPKVYRLSELHDINKKSVNSPIPTILKSHSKCRHILTMVPPDFGFNAEGKIEFKEFGYDIYKSQRG